MVGVLIFVHHDILPAVLVIFEDFRFCFKKANSFAKKVVKIQRARFMKFLLICVINPCGHLHSVIAVSFRKVRKILRILKAFLRVADCAKQRFRRKLFFLHIEVFKTFFNNAKAVVGVINGKTFRKVDCFSITAKDSYAHAVKS